MRPLPVKPIFVLGKSFLSTFVSPTPNSANSKNVTRNTFIGFMGGSFLAMIVVFLFAQFDIYVHDKKKLEETFDLPIIGLIPRYDVEEANDNV